MITQRQVRDRDLNFARGRIKGIITQLENINKNYNFIVCTEEGGEPEPLSNTAMSLVLIYMRRVRLIGIQEIMDESEIPENRALRFLAIRKWRKESKQRRQFTQLKQVT